MRCRSLHTEMGDSHMNRSDREQVFPWTNRSLLATAVAAGKAATRRMGREGTCVKVYLLMATVAMVAMAVAPAMAEQPEGFSLATDAWTTTVSEGSAATWDAVGVAYAQADGAPSSPGIDYGAVPTPELGTWALLLATGALGGWVRRRRKD